MVHPGISIRADGIFLKLVVGLENRFQELLLGAACKMKRGAEKMSPPEKGPDKKQVTFI